MLRKLLIKNIALIDELECEFGDGLNVLTGETGSGKSIIVDSLNALTGERVYSELVKDGAASAVIEGEFVTTRSAQLAEIFEQGGVELSVGDPVSVIVRREISLAGRNRIFINDQMVTQAFLKRVGGSLVNIHGQGEQASLYDSNSHIELLDRFAENEDRLSEVTGAYVEWSKLRAELDAVRADAADKLQLVDILTFQANEIDAAAPQAGEDEDLEAEKLLLNNAGKLNALSDDVFKLLYDQPDSTLATLERARHKIEELSQFEPSFGELLEGVGSAEAVLHEAAIAARDLRGRIEFSPERLNEIEDRMAALSQLKRKYGGTLESVAEHLSNAREKLAKIESSDLLEKELTQRLDEAFARYVTAASHLHESRQAACGALATHVVADLAAVALENARFEARIIAPDDPMAKDIDASTFTRTGFDQVEFYFSANPGEPTRPLSKIVSGGEASRLMLIIKTVTRGTPGDSAAVFDEIDSGIGGRVAEAVGRKLKDLSTGQQVLCVTHQAQIASQADRHFVVEKSHGKDETSVRIFEIGDAERIEEIARMLAGEKITDAARQNARTMLASAR